MRRKFIREKIVEVLKGANIEMVGNDIFPFKTTPHDDTQLPIITVYPENESSETFDESPKRYMKNLSVTIEIITVHNSEKELLNELDAIADEAEFAIENDAVLNGFQPYDKEKNKCINQMEAVNLQYSLEEGGSAHTGSIKMSYSFEYIKDAIEKRVLSNFNGLDNKWVIGDHEGNDAIDNVNLEET